MGIRVSDAADDEGRQGPEGAVVYVTMSANAFGGRCATGVGGGVDQGTEIDPSVYSYAWSPRCSACACRWNWTTFVVQSSSSEENEAIIEWAAE